MENKNGRGIFLGVVGVATLVVAIIGATFAYFTASANGTTGAATAGAATMEGTISIPPELEVTTGLRNNMIPVTESIVQTSYRQTGSGAKAKCAGLSAAGGDTVYNLCSTYTFTVKNSASVAQTVYIGLTSTNNGFANLWYALYDGDTIVTNGNATSANGGLTSEGTAVPEDGPAGVFKKLPVTSASDTNITSTLLAATDGVKTYTLVMYIHELSTEDHPMDQTEADSGKTFAGTINVTSSDGSNYVTGKIDTSVAQG